MKVSWSWLQDWVSLEGLQVDEVAERLTAAGLEVEAIERLGQGHDRIVVAKILSMEPHPKADRLAVCQVDAGEGKPRQIVCGATNMKVGDLVPAALPGARPPAMDFEIAEREMRGVRSEGMLCSSTELGQPKQSVDGLWILPAGLTLGQPIFEAMGLVDTVIHIGVTPNRSDALSHRGVARDIAALYGRALRPLSAPAPASEAGAWSVKLTDAEGCPRYAFAVIEGAQVGESPAWLRDRLAALGMRSISNAVDVTNYVMMDIGQPLHVFDLDRLEGAEHVVEVRRARAGERMVGIDHKDYALSADDLVIADGVKPVAMAGVMGGAATEVEQGCTRILLECAWFNPTLVRKGARRHGLHTESSHRFERCVDPGQTAQHLGYALDVLARAMPGITITQRGMTQAVEAAPVTITLPRGLTNRVLGTDWSDDRVRSAMEQLGLVVQDGGDGEAGSWRVTAPTARPDLERPIDLVEEVARLVGLSEIPVTLPISVMGGAHEARDQHGPTIVSDAQRGRLSAVRGLLAAQGVYEAYNYSFMSEAELELVGHPRALAVELANPMTVDHALMRTSLVPGLLRNLKSNLAQKIADVALFEIGRRYLSDRREPRTLGLAWMGSSPAHWQGQQAWDFYRAKGLIEAICADTALELAWEVPSALSVYLHPGVQAALVDAQGREVARLGKLHPGIAQREGLGNAMILFAELDLELLLSAERRVRTYATASRFPAVVRDYALLLDRETSYGAVEAALRGLGAGALSGVLEGWRLFDVYEGAQVPQGKRSLAIEVVLRSAHQTFTEEEVARLSAQIVASLESEVGAQLRM
jgi:phenylalanyl-tRNA synthetase beta chain